MPSIIQVANCKDILLKLSDLPNDIPNDVAVQITTLKNSLEAVIKDGKSSIRPRESVTKTTYGKILRYVYATTALLLNRMAGKSTVYYYLDMGKSPRFNAVANLIATGKPNRQASNMRASDFSRWAKYFINNLMSDELFSMLAYKYEQNKFYDFQRLNKVQSTLLENELITAYPKVYKFLTN